MTSLRLRSETCVFCTGGQSRGRGGRQGSGPWAGRKWRGEPWRWSEPGSIDPWGCQDRCCHWSWCLDGTPAQLASFSSSMNSTATFQGEKITVGGSTTEGRSTIQIRPQQRISFRMQVIHGCKMISSLAWSGLGSSTEESRPTAQWKIIYRSPRIASHNNKMDASQTCNDDPNTAYIHLGSQFPLTLVWKLTLGGLNG